LVILGQPSNVVAGQTINPAVQVELLDRFGNLAAGSVTVRLAKDPGAATLSGTTTVPAVAGVATFGNLSLNKVGTGYELRITEGSLPALTSTLFNVTPGAAVALVFGQQPRSTVAGTPISPALTVRVVDAFGNTVSSSTVAVTIALGNKPAGGTLTGTLTVNAVNGVATFNNLVLTKAFSGYTLTATISGLRVATSNRFTITPAAVALLAFGRQPANTKQGKGMAPVTDARGGHLRQRGNHQHRGSDGSAGGQPRRKYAGRHPDSNRGSWRGNLQYSDIE